MPRGAAAPWATVVGPMPSSGRSETIFVTWRYSVNVCAHVCNVYVHVRVLIEVHTSFCSISPDRSRGGFDAPAGFPWRSGPRQLPAPPPHPSSRDPNPTLLWVHAYRQSLSPRGGWWERSCVCVCTAGFEVRSRARRGVRLCLHQLVEAGPVRCSTGSGSTCQGHG